MSQRIALITGVNGGIGQTLCGTFQQAGWLVIGTDQQHTNASTADRYFTMDLVRLCRNHAYRSEKSKELITVTNHTGLNALINNAAIQILAPVEQLTTDDWHTTMDSNLIAPFILTKILLPELLKHKGSVINMGSIHALLTKPLFTAYATSKAALTGLTKAMAVELGDRIRVNAICPAAITTPMLAAGFADNPNGLKQLEKYHPSGCLGSPEEVAQAALYLAEVTGFFLNGTILGLDGGIASRLHDPD